MWTQNVNVYLKPSCHLANKVLVGFIRCHCMAVSHWPKSPELYVKNIKAPSLRGLCECP